MELILRKETHEEEKIKVKNGLLHLPKRSHSGSCPSVIVITKIDTIVMKQNYIDIYSGCSAPAGIFIEDEDLLEETYKFLIKLIERD